MEETAATNGHDSKTMEQETELLTGTTAPETATTVLSTATGTAGATTGTGAEVPRSLFQNWSDGFTYLRRRRDNGKDVILPGTVLPPFLSHVTIHFVDPTATSIAQQNQQQPQSGAASEQQQPQNQQQQQPLYETFSSIFQSDYQSSLSYIPYQLFRNNSSGVIERLKINLLVTRSHGGIIETEDDDDNDDAQSGGSGAASPKKNAWERPYCHVYLAACESLEHYRTKVKPSIQVFVSQLEAAASKQQQQQKMAAESPMSNNSSTISNVLRRQRSSSSFGSGGEDTNPNSSTNANSHSQSASPPTSGKVKSGGGSHSNINAAAAGAAHSNKLAAGPRYVLVYVPTGDRSRHAEDIISPKKSGTAVGLVGRFAAARQRMAAVRGSGAGTGTTESNSVDLSGHQASSTTNSRHSNHSNNNSKHGDIVDNDDNNPASSASSTMIQKLSKTEREILRRLANDFPNGNVCSLSTLAEQANALQQQQQNPDEDSAHNELDGSIQSQHGMGNDFTKLEWNAVLKAMGAAVTASFSDRCQRYDDELRQLMSRRDDFPLHHFWLVKETLAFTYEQMRLPVEALLQYDELRAFLPDPDDALPPSTLMMRRKTTATSPENQDADAYQQHLQHVARTGQALEFRQILQSRGDYEAVGEVAQDYLLARECALLFQMHKSVRIAQRCLSYVQSTTQLRRTQIAQAADEDFYNNQDGSDAERRRGQQLVELDKWAFNFCWNFKKASDCYRGDILNDGSGHNKTNKSGSSSTSVTAVDVAFARILGDLLEFGRRQLVQLGDQLVPDHVVRLPRGFNVQAIEGPWAQWTEPPADALSNNADSTILPVPMDTELLDDALSSSEKFLMRYLDLSQVLANCYEFSGRKRLASHLRIQRMELLASRGNQAQAVREILAFVDIFQKDGWSTCHFALLFRLAFFQRQIASATDYLRTLVQCFSESMLTVAPGKAREALQADLEAVLQSESISGTRLPSATLFSPAFGLEGISASQVQGTDRNLLKRLYTVGDTVGVTFALESFLPRTITIDQIAVQLVPFRAYVAAMEDNVPVCESDFFRTLTVDQAKVDTGKNEFTLNWMPKNAGQYILASALVKWRGAEFVYTAKELRRPTIRIDVVPCDATQNLTVAPDYLLPGQEQLVTFDFTSGTDVVKEGTLHVVAPPGMLILPPAHERDKDSGVRELWTSSFDVPLPACPPTETVQLKSWVKVALAPKSGATIQPLQVKATTSYSYSSDGQEEAQPDALATTLEVQVPVLTKPALSVVDGSFMAYSAFNAMMNVILRCNAPAPVTIQGWHLELPPYVELTDGGDLNSSLSNEQVSNGENISFSFDCYFRDGSSAPETKQDDPLLHVDFTTKVGEKFRESLKLRILRSAFPTVKPPEVKPVTVQVVCALKEGVIGSPVNVSYAVDRSQLADLKGEVHYQIDIDNSDWILSGLMEGRVDVAGTEATPPSSIDVVAIPLRCGRITRFPRISLSFQMETGGSSALPVDMGVHPVFTSLSLGTHQSVAFPSSTAPRRALPSPRA